MTWRRGTVLIGNTHSPHGSPIRRVMGGSRERGLRITGFGGGVNMTMAAGFGPLWWKIDVRGGGGGGAGSGFGHGTNGGGGGGGGANAENIGGGGGGGGADQRQGGGGDPPLPGERLHQISKTQASPEGTWGDCVAFSSHARLTSSAALMV